MPQPSPLQSAISHYEKGDLSAARTILLEVDRQSPNDFEALRLLGFIAGQEDDFDSAAMYLQKAVGLRPTFVEGWYYLAKSFMALNRPEQSIPAFDRAIGLYPQFFEALHDRGLALFALNRFDAAIASFQHACSVNPMSAEAWTNMAVVFRCKNDIDHAIECYQRALQLSPGNTFTLYKLGTAYSIKGRHRDAVETFASVLAINPDAEYAKGFLFSSRLFNGDWSTFHADKESLHKGIREGKRESTPFVALAMSGSPEEHLKVARRFVEENPAPVVIPERQAPDAEGGAKEGRATIAYLSADFYGHATAVLMLDVIKKHDRNRFKIVAISFGPDRPGALTDEIRAAFDQFIDVRSQSDTEVAERMRDIGVDIAVDLKGYTHDSRPGILSFRPAPIQVNYLGYPGTMGVDYMDYLIADRFVIPDGEEQFYSEAIVVLPDSYQPNGKNRVAVNRDLSRAECGLPADGIVFCSFNSPYKNNPIMFDIWMDLLVAVDASVLWLFSLSEVFEHNIKAEAQRRGVHPERLIFAHHVPLPEHLHRIGLADIFLDSLPYGAHTTASDALWANVPVVTCVGTAFPGRVGQSLLEAIEMPELIAHTLADYYALALSLATDKKLLHETRQKLAAKVKTAPLFDSDRYTAHLEQAFEAMLQKHGSGQPASKIVVKDISAKP
jgi:protein O-GlcNAc transferase